MSDNTNRSHPASTAYEPPTVTPVRVDPVRDMLSGCSTKSNTNIARCNPALNGGHPPLT
jgi:hypothetical protein